MNSFWEMWLAITLWMAVSYGFIYCAAACLSAIMLRKHSWMLMITIPLIGKSYKLNFPIAFGHLVCRYEFLMCSFSLIFLFFFFVMFAP